MLVPLTGTSRPLQGINITLRRPSWIVEGHRTMARSPLGVLIAWSTSGTRHRGGSCTSYLGTMVPLMRPLSIPPSPSSDPAAATSRSISASFRMMSLPQIGIPLIFGYERELKNAGTVLLCPRHWMLDCWLNFQTATSSVPLRFLLNLWWLCLLKF